MRGLDGDRSRAQAARYIDHRPDAGGFAPLAPVLIDSLAFARIFFGRNKRKLCCLQNADTHRR
jgi:hypothetical protein